MTIIIVLWNLGKNVKIRILILFRMYDDEM